MFTPFNSYAILDSLEVPLLALSKTSPFASGEFQQVFYSSSFTFSIDYFTFSPSPKLLQGTMTSADFWRLSCILLYRLSRVRLSSRDGETSRQISPGIHIIFHSIYLSNLLHSIRAFSDFALHRKLVHTIQPHIRFLFIRPEFCRRLPSDSTSRWTPLS